MLGLSEDVVYEQLTGKQTDLKTILWYNPNTIAVLWCMGGDTIGEEQRGSMGTKKSLSVQ